MKKLALRCHSPKVTVMAVAQEVRQNRNLASLGDILAGKQRVPSQGQAACPGQQQLLALLTSPAPGLAGRF